MYKLLFIDRDGVLIEEPSDDFQVDSFQKLRFMPKLFTYLGKIAKELDYQLVLVTNQDGLGTTSFPYENFIGPHNLLMNTLRNEGIYFIDECIDRSFEEENSPNRKPKLGMLQQFLNGDFDLVNSFVIGDRSTDMELANNLGSKGILFQHASLPFATNCCLQTNDWEQIYQYLKSNQRKASILRTTKETRVEIRIQLDGTGNSNIQTGIPFFNHLLEQISKHGQLDLWIRVDGDLEVDEHHTIEDTALGLGAAFKEALGNKMGIERYGFTLPMDDCLAQVAIDFGGRNWLVWDAIFQREMIGKMPTEMFIHFFKSFSDAAQCNINIQATGQNEHHKIEAIFKAFAKAIKQAKTRDDANLSLPTTKGII